MNVASMVRALRDNASHMRRASGVGLVILAGLFMMRLSAFVISILVARLAGAESLGQYTLFLTVFILASEIPHAFDTAYLRAAGTPEGIAYRQVYAAANVAVKLSLLAVMTTVLFVLSEMISQALGKPMGGKIIAWAVLCGGLNSIFMVLPATAQLRRDFRTVALLKPLFNLSVLCLILVLLGIGLKLSIDMIVSVYLAVGIVLSMLELLATFRGFTFHQSDLEVIRPYLGAAMALFTSTAIGMVSGRLDVFFIGYYLDFSELGVYGVALRISVVVSVMTGAISTIMIPRAAEAAIDSTKFRRYIALGGFYSAIQFMFAMVLLLFIEPLIIIVFGIEYSRAALPTTILIIQVLIFSSGIPYQALLQCGARPSRMIYIAIIKFVITVPLMMFLAPSYGVTGAAVAVTTTTFLTTIIMVMLAIKHRPMRNHGSVSVNG